MKENNNRIILWVLVLALLLLLILFLVHISYSIKQKFIITELSADAVLGYFGSFTGCIVSAVIAVIGFKISDLHRKEDKEKEERNTKRPFFIISKIYYKNDEKLEVPYKTNHFEITLQDRVEVFIEIKNIGEGPAIDFRYSLSNKTPKPFIEDYQSIKTVMPEQTALIRFNRNIIDDYGTVDDSIGIIYQNIKGCNYSQIIKYTFEKNPYSIDESNSAVDYQYIFQLISNQLSKNNKEENK